MKHRLLSILLALVLVVTIFPINSYAAKGNGNGKKPGKGEVVVDPVDPPVDPVDPPVDPVDPPVDPVDPPVDPPTDPVDPPTDPVEVGIDMGANTSEILQTINNPERGFYKATGFMAKQSGNQAVSSKDKLVHLRVGIGCFSDNYRIHNGETGADLTAGGYDPLSEDFLAALNQTMDNYRQSGASVIIRFAYDNFNGIADMEPTMDGVLLHISQLKDFFAANEDVLLAVESGFLGPWGEQHTSAYFDRDKRQANMKTLVDAVLDVVPKSLTVSVRRPLYYAYAAGIDLTDLRTHRAEPGSKYYNLGMFDDGYLGSQSDLGTYSDREMEVTWLEYQTGHTVFGGEVSANSSTDGKAYNSIDYISEEMFRTHTSYLNIGWNETVINQWRNGTYNGENPVYKGQNAFTYVENHLGYRLVLRDSKYYPEAGQLHFTVENVGAGNIYKEKSLEVNLVDSKGNVKTIATDIDVRTWESRTKQEEVISLPQGLSDETYGVYVQIKDKNNNTIRFANDNTFNKYGNYIGGFVVGDGAGTIPEQPTLQDGVDLNGVWHIATEETLFDFAKRVQAGDITLNAVLEQDITLTRNWTPIAIGDYYYKGTFDGQGHSIKNVIINRTGTRTGFFSTLQTEGVVRNLNLYGTVQGEDVVGAFVGYCKGTVENCKNYCTVTGTYRAGGITSYNNAGATVKNCYNYGKITSPDTAGGITAYNKVGSVIGCINEGAVSSPRFMGGIVGQNTVDGIITDCEDRAGVLDDIEYDETASIFCWNYYLLNEGSYPIAREFLKELKVDRVYQEISKRYLKYQESADMVARLNADGIEVVALAGEANWGLKDYDLTSLKTYIDTVAEYNQGIGKNAKINKLGLDIETHITSQWKADPASAFEAYVVQMREVYLYAHSKGLEVIQIVPVHLDKISATTFRTFVETCCDELSLMNYTKSSQVSGISGEVAVCRELGIPVETIFETMANSETHGVSEENSYFYDGFEALCKKREEIFKAYNYEKMSVSYHHFPTVYHVVTGKYMAEIYGYTSNDPSADDLGQTDAVTAITLTGDDGSVIKAGLYNPNRSATYPETCYLAIGVKPGVTYTITADHENYTVTTAPKQFNLADDRLVDYTSIRLRYETPAVEPEEPPVEPEEPPTEPEEPPVEPEEPEIPDVPETPAAVYSQLSKLADGEEYVLACNGYVMAADLAGVALTKESCEGGYHLNLSEDKNITWKYQAGKISCVQDGKTYYLAANGKTAVKLVTSASEGSTWTYASGRLTTPNGKKELCLTVSAGKFILTSGKAGCEVYMEK